MLPLFAAAAAVFVFLFAVVQFEGRIELQQCKSICSLLQFWAY
jgi:hypothetical protein